MNECESVCALRQGKKALARPRDWHFTVFQTGALPQLETPDAFIGAYDDFLAARP